MTCIYVFSTEQLFLVEVLETLDIRNANGVCVCVLREEYTVNSFFISIETNP